jgi:hypothetical protein
VYNGFIACLLLLETVGIRVPDKSRKETSILSTLRFQAADALLFAVP